MAPTEVPCGAHLAAIGKHWTVLMTMMSSTLTVQSVNKIIKENQHIFSENLVKRRESVTTNKEKCEGRERRG